MFECDKCGLCCIGLDKNEATADLHNGDGICKYLDLKTMLCTIYEERPIFCRVDEYFDLYLADKMDKEEFMCLNYEACQLKKKEFEECGRDIYKMVSKVPDVESKKQEVLTKSLDEALGERQ